MNNQNTIRVNVIGHGEHEIEQGTTLQALSERFSFPRTILVAKKNNELKELYNPLRYDCTVEFLDISDANGYRVYQRSASYLMIYAVKKVLAGRGKSIKQSRVVIAHSINKNFYCELPDLGEPVTDELLAEIETVMKDAVTQNLKIEKVSLPLETGLRIAAEMGMDDKVELLKYRRTSAVNFYKLDGFYDYFYGRMAPNTGCLQSFKLTRRFNGFLLQFPAASHDYALAEAAPNTKISEVFEESNQWARALNIDTVGSLNNKLCTSGIGEVIRVTEALHEKKIANLADQIMQDHKRIVLIAGPTSSGKTTFAARLSVQLRVNGVQPYVISLDNYYVNREHTPKDADGKPDLETIKAIDVAQINKDMSALLKGETVQIPSYNFLTGQREYKGHYLTLKPDDVLIVEGIHGLNGAIGEGISRDDTFRIFISALTQINIDDHNRIPTTDTRLVRRIVRDHQFRGYSADKTIEIWPSVVRGEGNYIFPFQEEADAFFNSALVYEMCVLKQFAEPLLFGIGKEHPSYTEARRLIKFLDGFLGATSESVPINSILREFVGGSCFGHGH
ncbi:MAG: nucleoside kinase [Defluviitaleaceae bacterium]|nr:nucleoside kinase [Defluviitaleaceae bacterium]